jgi:cytochrome P450
MDHEDHSRVRKTALHAFTARRVEEFRLRARAIFDTCLTDMLSQTAPADFVRHVSTPFAYHTVCEFLGLTIDERERFEDFARVLRNRNLDIEALEQERRSFEAFISGFLTRRRSDPGEALVDHLIAARDDEQISEAELVNLVIAILLGGSGTPQNALTSMIYVLSNEQDLWLSLKDNPEQVPGAVEELLRFIPLGVAGGFTRVATENLVLGGVEINAGDALIPAMISANRDETVFEDPDLLRLDRGKNPHFAFGHGMHHCIGAQLARVELQEALHSLLARTPDLRVGVPEGELIWRRGEVNRGLDELPVAW